MKILAHRGDWKNHSGKNSKESLESCIRQSLGIETDIRDFKGELILSHDIPRPEANHYLLEDLFNFYTQVQSSSSLALNIKSDGLSLVLLELLNRWGITNYFTFDMSVPEQKVYSTAGLKFLSRISELETSPILFERSEGIWLDSFYSDWYDLPLLLKYLETGKKVCVVSPELHQRPHIKGWDILHQVKSYDNLYLCTDLITEASDFFL